MITCWEWMNNAEWWNENADTMDGPHFISTGVLRRRDNQRKAISINNHRSYKEEK